MCLNVLQALALGFGCSRCEEQRRWHLHSRLKRRISNDAAMKSEISAVGYVLMEQFNVNLKDFLHNAASNVTGNRRFSMYQTRVLS